MQNLSPERLIRAILHTAAYADVFDYPLTLSEIHRYLTGLAVPFESLEKVLKRELNLLSSVDGYFTLPGREKIVTTRRRRAQIAARLWPQALQYGLIISRLPFVRMVAVTGALAVDNVEEDADIDYLIVTEPGRLWFCRAMALLVGRFSALRGITLCPNYIVTLRALTFPDQNEYAAHEMAQMIPIAGMDVYTRIRQQNAWVTRFLPNSEGPPSSIFSPALPVYHTLTRPTLEKILSTRPFSRLERWEMDRKIRKLAYEQRASLESSFSADFCKGHDRSHQAHTFDALNDRFEQLELNQ